ncbi:helix-turn-helix domain-containing protein [Agrobacterium leguminum]|uniref:helix-turn-helix domain-containing protein n=1 Tax=Agrobacterium leguminum TaxID=2792015 RepID=UPI00272C4629|nr:helix-turn-helix domain-containing protein [Agrobacterium leguminum]WLD95786.1 helix-turn-helix domain-containing protein [Agrobacterium leguminum]
MHRDRTADKATAKLRLQEMERVKRLLLLAGIALRDVDREYDLPRGIAGRTLVEPNIKGERAIAAALKTRPHLLWQSRYHGNGTRRTPQPKENYIRPPTMAERRAEADARPEAA